MYTVNVCVRNADGVQPLPSGTQTPDMLERLCEEMYVLAEAKRGEDAANRKKKKNAAIDLTAAVPSPDSNNVALNETTTDGDQPVVARPGLDAQGDCDTSGDPPVTGVPKDVEDGGPPVTGAPKDVEDGGGTSNTMPMGWFPPYILLAAAWSPWSGSTPGEWRNLEMSSGPSVRNEPKQEASLQEENPLSNPDILKRQSVNGEPMSRRNNEKAVKAEKEDGAERKPLRRTTSSRGSHSTRGSRVSRPWKSPTRLPTPSNRT